MSYPIARMRELFELAVDVKDNKLEKALNEADLLDYMPQVGYPYGATNKSYIADGNGYAGAEKVLCYYAFARYLQISDQNSTSTGLKIQTYGGSLVVPDTSKNKRFESERGKADLFCETLVCKLKEAGLVKSCSTIYNTRINLIK